MKVLWFVTIANEEMGKESATCNEENENHKRYIGNRCHESARLFVRCVIEGKVLVL